jgi:hypothetical protein
MTMRESGMSALWLKQILFTVFTTLGCLVRSVGAPGVLCVASAVQPGE